RGVADRLEHDPEKACPGLDPGCAAVFGQDAPAKSYSGWMLAALTSSPRRARPRLIRSASSAGVPGATTRPSVASFSLIGGSSRILRAVSLIREMIGAGVAAGTNSPSQDDISKPGNVSPTVGTSGIAA